MLYRHMLAWTGGSRAMKSILQSIYSRCLTKRFQMRMALEAKQISLSQCYVRLRALHQ